MLAVTVGGIFIVSLLINVLSSGLQNKLEELRKGRSFVVEEGHTLILGWSSRVFLIIRELAIANENQRRPRVVVLADRDKVEMEEEIRSKVGGTRNTRVVCRSGNPIDLVDLEIVNPHAAKSIIILSPGESPDADAQVIKMILAITNNPNRREEPYHVVAEIRDEKNMEVARIVGRDEAKLVLPGDIIARITVQTCLQVGLSIVYTELPDYGGDENLHAGGAAARRPHVRRGAALLRELLADGAAPARGRRARQPAEVRAAHVRARGPDQRPRGGLGGSFRHRAARGPCPAPPGLRRLGRSPRNRERRRAGYLRADGQRCRARRHGAPRARRTHRHGPLGQRPRPAS